jgi:RNA polymerase sigma-70 factor, ECF subfamily
MQSALFVVRSDDSRAVPGGEEPAVRDRTADRLAEGFAALVERHGRVVYRVALAVVRQADAAEDVVQETFLEAYRGGRWQRMEDERAYLAQVAWRLAVRHRKRHAREQELPVEITSARPGPEQWAMGRQMERWLHARIDELPETLREPLVLAALGELKLVEIARMMGLPEGTVRRRIHEARARLKEQLRARKGASDE